MSFLVDVKNTKRIKIRCFHRKHFKILKCLCFNSINQIRLLVMKKKEKERKPASLLLYILVRLVVVVVDPHPIHQSFFTAYTDGHNLKKENPRLCTSEQ